MGQVWYLNSTAFKLLLCFSSPNVPSVNQFKVKIADYYAITKTEYK